MGWISKSVLIATRSELVQNYSKKPNSETKKCD